MRAATVYLVTNNQNGKRYVGLTRFTCQARWKQHVRNAAAGKRTYLFAAIRKYGADSFSVMDVASCLSLETATQVERAVIQSLRPEYNQTNGGEFTAGRRVPRSVVEKIRASNLGKKRTAEHNELQRRLGKERYKNNPELRAKMAKQLERVRSSIDHEKRIAAVRESLKTRVWSDESRAKLSASCIGRKHPPEVIARIAAKKCRPVECITLATVFDSLSEAAELTGIHVSTISKACLGKIRTAHGLQFKFIEECCK